MLHLFNQPVFTGINQSPHWVPCIWRERPRAGRGAMTKLKLGGSRNDETEESSSLGIVTHRAGTFNNVETQLCGGLRCQQMARGQVAGLKNQLNRAIRWRKWWKFKRRIQNSRPWICALNWARSWSGSPWCSWPLYILPILRPESAAFLGSLQVWARCLRFWHPCTVWEQPHPQYLTWKVVGLYYCIQKPLTKQVLTQLYKKLLLGS